MKRLLLIAVLAVSLMLFGCTETKPNPQLSISPLKEKFAEGDTIQINLFNNGSRIFYCPKPFWALEAFVDGKWQYQQIGNWQYIDWFPVLELKPDETLSDEWDFVIPGIGVIRDRQNGTIIANISDRNIGNGKYRLSFPYFENCQERTVYNCSKKLNQCIGIQEIDSNSCSGGKKAYSQEFEFVSKEIDSVTDLKYEIELLDAPRSVQVGLPFTVSWKVTHNNHILLRHTAIHYGPEKEGGELTETSYPFMTPEKKGPTPTPCVVQNCPSELIETVFYDTIMASPERNIYLRAHAIIDGKDYWSEEKLVSVMTSLSQYPSPASQIPQDNETCLQQGGVWARGDALDWSCYQKTSDGGKECTDSSQCEGIGCISSDKNAKTGTCNPYNQLLHCAYLLKNGKIDTPMLCP